MGVLLIDRRTLPGIAVRARTAASDRAARGRAPDHRRGFLSGEISIATGPHMTRAKRRDLGASLALGELPEHLLELGRTGNPLVDLATFWDIALNGRDVLWAPSIDRIVLGRYVHAIRRNVERPPIAGSTDGEGWSIAGAPGLTLDTVSAIDTIERALRHGDSSVASALREVPAPRALDGLADAVLYDGRARREEMVDLEQLAAGDYAAANGSRAS